MKKETESPQSEAKNSLSDWFKLYTEIDMSRALVHVREDLDSEPPGERISNDTPDEEMVNRRRQALEIYESIPALSPDVLARAIANNERINAHLGRGRRSERVLEADVIRPGVIDNNGEMFSENAIVGEYHQPVITPERPENPDIGELWITSDGFTYRWDGVSWTSIPQPSVGMGSDGMGTFREVIQKENPNQKAALNQIGTIIDLIKDQITVTGGTLFEVKNLIEKHGCTEKIVDIMLEKYNKEPVKKVTRKIRLK